MIVAIRWFWPKSFDTEPASPNKRAFRNARIFQREPADHLTKALNFDDSFILRRWRSKYPNVGHHVRPCDWNRTESNAKIRLTNLIKINDSHRIESIDEMRYFQEISPLEVMAHCLLRCGVFVEWTQVNQCAEPEWKSRHFLRMSFDLNHSQYLMVHFPLIIDTWRRGKRQGKMKCPNDESDGSAERQGKGEVDGEKGSELETEGERIKKNYDDDPFCQTRNRWPIGVRFCRFSHCDGQRWRPDQTS